MSHQGPSGTSLHARYAAMSQLTPPQRQCVSSLDIKLTHLLAPRPLCVCEQSSTVCLRNEMAHDEYASSSLSPSNRESIQRDTASSSLSYQPSIWCGGTGESRAESALLLCPASIRTAPVVTAGGAKVSGEKAAFPHVSLKAKAGFYVS